MLSSATEDFSRFPDQSVVEIENYNYFMEDFNFQDVPGQVGVGAA